MRKEIRISGFGGQGVALAGLILGKALTIYSDYEAVMTQSYGPEARGGASSVNLVLADEPVDYPFVQHPDILAALSQEGYSHFKPSAKRDAVIIIDEDLVNPDEDDDPYCIPATRLAESLGRRMVANVVMLGHFTSLTKLTTREAVEKAISSTMKPKIVELNLKAFEIGFTQPTRKFRDSKEL